MRADRHSERGQIMPLLALTIVTMGIMALVAVSFGQAVVRRQQAQMIVDAAAFAGAAEQAKGLNTIARLNEKSLNIINGVIMAQGEGWVFGYQDNYTTTNTRLYCLFCTGPDWSSDNWHDYEDTFDTLNTIIDDVNRAYGVYAKPSRAAAKVVRDNFRKGGPEAIFADEDPVSAGAIVWDLDKPSALMRMVDLTEPQEYAVADGRRYKPHPGALHEFCSTWCAPTLVFYAKCYATCRKAQQAHYAAINTYFNTIELAWKGVPRYEAGRFYDNQSGKDVRFSYHLRVAGPKPLVGAAWFGDVPDIVVAATAKPYGGYLGDEWEDTIPSPIPFWQRFGYEQQDNKEIEYEYRAKLIPMRTLEKRQLAVDIEGYDVYFDPQRLARYLSAIH